MIEWLLANWDKIGAVLGLIIGPIGIYLGYKGWRRKGPMCVLRSNNIFSGLEHTPDVEVKFAGYGPLIKSLTVTKVAFWNGGNELIQRQDIVKEDPVALRAKEGVILLSVNILEVTTPYNKIECHITQERTQAIISFDYLDHKQGALLQVFHTGKSNDDILVQGTIKGAKEITRRQVGSMPPKRTPSRWVGVFLVCILWVALISLYVFLWNAEHETTEEITQKDLELSRSLAIFIIAFITISASVLSGCVLYFLYCTQVPKPLSKIHWVE